MSALLRATCLAATIGAALVAAILLIPALMSGSLDSGPHHIKLFNAYLFFAIAAPVTGVVSLIVHAVSKTLRTRAAIVTSVVAVASGGLWLVLFPYVFFASGGSR